jgi:alanine-glyoxylate transaminase/serine-glyoxylate transaminase/serine-pyruvate transaminase
MSSVTGRHFLQVPGPTNVPDRILRAIDSPTIDHRGPDFQQLTRRLLDGLALVFKTTGPVVVYPSSGTGAWEAALTNTLSPGDEVLCFETGHFSTLWAQMARRLGLVVHLIEGDWKHGVNAQLIADRLSRDTARAIRAVMVVHNETSTGVKSAIPDVRAAIDSARHDALLLVDTISSLGSIDYRHEEWGVDVTVSGSQKGLMLPPGLGFNAISNRALDASKKAKMPRSYWDWEPILRSNADGFFPYTPATNLLFGLDAALSMLIEEGLPAVFARHTRHAEATRAAVQGWGLEILAADPREYSDTLTAVVVPAGTDADQLRKVILESYNMSLGAGLGRLAGKVFRIGHLGSLNDLTLAGTLAGVQLGLIRCGIDISRLGVPAALDRLAVD